MKSKQTLVIVLFVLCAIASPAYAVTKTNSASGGTNTSGAQEVKGAMAKTKCTLVETRVNNQITKFDNGKSRYFNSYNNLDDRLTKLEVKLSGRGYDTAKLKTDIATLKTKIDKFSADYNSYIAAFRDTQSYACGKSEGDFRAKLTEARNLLKTVHQDSKEIKQYYHDTIRVDLQAIKKQTPTIKKPASSSGDTATSTTGEQESGE